MRMTFGLVAMAMAAAAPAGAADLPLRGSDAPIVMAAPSAYDWSGFFVGGQIGYNWNREHTREYFTANGAYTGLEWHYQGSGLAGGFHIGANHQIGLAVAGVVADFDFLSGRGTFVDPGGSGVFHATWQASVRARFGLAFDRLLVYATGGVAFARTSYAYTNPAGPVTEGFAGVRTGWTVGLGANYALTDRLIAGLEYRYAHFGTFSNVSTVAFPGLTGTQAPRLHAVRLTASYRF